MTRPAAFAATLCGHEIRLDGDDAIWQTMAEFFAPYYQIARRASDKPDITVAASVSSAGERPDTPCTNMHLYVAHSEAELLPDGKERHRRPSGAEVILDRQNRHVSIVARHPVELNLELRIMMRDQIFLPLERAAGWAMFHAACVQRDGHAAFFMGERQAGKTTALMCCLSTGLYDIVASDRIKLFISEKTGRVGLAGHPSNTNLHQRTVESDPLTRSLVAELAGRYDHESKFSISTQRIASLAGCAVVPQAVPAIVVFPRVDPDANGLSVWRMRSRGEVARLIAENAINLSSSNERPRWLGLVPPLNDEGAANIELAAAAAARECGAYGMTGTHAQISSFLRNPEWEEALASIPQPEAEQTSKGRA